MVSWNASRRGCLTLACCSAVKLVRACAEAWAPWGYDQSRNKAPILQQRNSSPFQASLFPVLLNLYVALLASILACCLVRLKYISVLKKKPRYPVTSLKAFNFKDIGHLVACLQLGRSSG